MWDYITNNSELILSALGQHVVLALLPVLLGAVLALPIAYAATRYRWLYTPLVTVSGLLYSIPSLALFLLLPGLLGTKVLSPINIVVALAIYTLALLVRTIADAIMSVEPNVLQAATAVGYTRGGRLRDVELPIALPVMLTGLRVASVSNISLVSVGAIMGVGGLGALFTRGLQLGYMPPIIVGIVLSVALAALVDLLIVAIQRRLTPWTRVSAGR
ncbi:ABC transporter permease subunit [Epidermidibacterium keratini]|uniref:ABC transporter permease subunit n=1 Tax=Epidermidibacterium keratini TaxID=1891644 RepID=A0A7L4YLJ7_9ACTN|nr:ABC transporter permease subunit [Epidermidibacterium keratini]QHB99742.1 ABC transporter permease subunit [Epidermidibacterium keratini]